MSFTNVFFSFDVDVFFLDGSKSSGIVYVGAKEILVWDLDKNVKFSEIANYGIQKLELIKGSELGVAIDSSIPDVDFDSIDL